MKTIVQAQNVCIEFTPDENIKVLDCYFSAKNVEVLMGTVPKESALIGIHIFGNNTSATPMVKLGGTTKDESSAATMPIAHGWQSDFGNVSEVRTSPAINWFYQNVAMNLVYDSNEIKLKIDNASFFTGYLYARAYFKIR